MSKQSKKKFQVAIKNRVKNAVNSSLDGDVLELYFLDLLENEEEFDWCSGEMVETNIVQEVINQVRYFNPSRILLTLDSEGGDASIGLAIYNYLKNCGAKIEVDVIGMAGSIVSVIMQAANKGKRLVARNSFVVIHQAWGTATGNSSDLRQGADIIDRYTAQIVDIYASNNTAGKTAEDIKALIANGDYWMTGEEAVAMGIADDTYNDNAQFKIAARIKDLNPHYTHVPQNLIQQEEITSDDESLTNIFNTLFMDIKSKVSAAIASIKGKKIDPKSGNLELEVANVISEPLQTLAAEIESQVAAEIQGIETSIMAKIKDAYEKRIEAVENVNAELKKSNDDLIQELADGIGKEGKTPPKAEVKPIGISYVNGVLVK